MPPFEIDFKPKDTDWFRCSTEVEFDCEQSPKRLSDTPYLMIGLGFIFAHKYDISTNVQSWTRESCSITGCRDARRYTGNLLVKVTETIGVGFGFGKGTVAIGYTTRPKRSTVPFVTDCICCDDDLSRPRKKVVGDEDGAMQPKTAAHDLIAVTLAASAVAGGLVVARAHPLSPLSQLFEVGVGLLTAAAFGRVVARAFLSSRSRSDDGHNDTPAGLASSQEA